MRTEDEQQEILIAVDREILTYLLGANRSDVRSISVFVRPFMKYGPLVPPGAQVIIKSSDANDSRAAKAQVVSIHESVSHPEVPRSGDNREIQVVLTNIRRLRP